MSLESHGAGKFVRARGSLEAQLLVLPTLEITNSLPYIMEVGDDGGMVFWGQYMFSQYCQRHVLLPLEDGGIFISPHCSESPPPVLIRLPSITSAAPDLNPKPFASLLLHLPRG